MYFCGLNRGGGLGCVGLRLWRVGRCYLCAFGYYCRFFIVEANSGPGVRFLGNFHGDSIYYHVGAAACFVRVAVVRSCKVFVEGFLCTAFRLTA